MPDRIHIEEYHNKIVEYYEKLLRTFLGVNCRKKLQELEERARRWIEPTWYNKKYDGMCT